MATPFVPKKIPFPKTREAFKKEITAVGVPVIFTDYCSDWNALQKWTPEYLGITVALTRKLLATETEGCEGVVFISDRKAVVKGSYTEQKMTIRQLLDKIKSEDYGKGSEQYYLAGDNLQKNFANLAKDVQPTRFGGPEEVSERIIEPRLTFIWIVLDKAQLASLGIWIGGDGQVSSAHFDCAQNINTVLRGVCLEFNIRVGKKTFTLAPPEAFLNMYAHTWKSCKGNDQDGQIYRFSQVDLLAPDLILFPNIKKINFSVVDVNKGETLYIPVGWWHHVQSFGDPSDGIHAAVNIFWDADDDYWTRKELRYIVDFRAKYT